ncbi:hypothetical protein NM688_g3435 [Phlebia brevispora]|uniref:Uncharacterized protein n=1 Tax=Phlebia brevispora TaxID=194682 RepID=A0ACC1T5I9_9APHY|nr:hypothetical protein NM688_g3435 [Phlebia brevispora]
MPRSKRNQQAVFRHVRPSDRIRIQSLSYGVRLQSIQTRLDALLSHASDNPTRCVTPTADGDFLDEACSRLEDEHSHSELSHTSHDGAPPVEENSEPYEEIASQSTPKKWRIQPDDEAHRFFQRFHAVLSDLEEPYLRYITQSLRKPAHTSQFAGGPCTSPGCSSRSSQVTLLYWDHFEIKDVSYCECTLLPVRLVQNGMFPSAPIEPRLAVSVHLLDFYSALFERSGDAVTAMAGALHKFYIQRGWQIINEKGSSTADPFWRGLGHAIQWYDMLKVNIERRVDDAIDRAHHVVTTYQESTGSGELQAPISQDCPIDSAPSPTGSDDVHDHSECSENKKVAMDTQRCADVLQKRCPACFGGRKFVRPLSEGGDIHIALDANFSHRHLRSAGDSPAFYHPSYFLPDHFVEEIDKRIQTRRKRPRNKTWASRVPDSVLDACEHGHEAANEHKVKTATLRYDDTGVMAMICRHDIPLFLVNMDTPGEQQKYAIALLEHLFSLLPSNATVKALYDIGCLLDRSIHLYYLLSDDIIQRLGWAISAMHSYGHGWACQLIYAPRFQDGSGETDGEGVERLWSKLRIIIHVTRSSARSRRLWILDRQVSAIGESALEDLGTNVERRYSRAVRQLEKAVKELDECREDPEELQRQWEHQRQEQMSIRNHAPARLKKDLDAILTLQSEVDKLENVILSTQKLLKITYKTDAALSELERLRGLHLDLTAQVDQLYASLNVDYLPPVLKSLPLEFLRVLILARDLKMNLRSRVIAHWLEWDRLDQATGGKDVALGTKLHQETRKKIAKRKPAVLTAIKKYNSYCECLETLLPSNIDFPLPRPLPTDLVSLRDCAHFMEDVWIAPSATAKPPRWLEDDNERHSQHSLRRHKWPTHLISDFRYDYHVRTALQSAERICRDQSPTAMPLQWMSPTILQEHLLTIVDDDEAADNPLDDLRWACPEDILLSDLVEDILYDDEELLILLTEPPEGSVVSVQESCAQIPPHTRSYERQLSPMSLSQTLKVDAHWVIQNALRADCFWEVWFFAAIPLPCTALAFARAWNFEERRVYFSPSDIARLADPHAWLNDVCIDDCASLLREAFGNVGQACAVFTTFEVSYLRCGAYGRLSRSARRNRYWERDIWLLPLYQENRKHWTLAVLVCSQRTIYHFDSFADEDALLLVENLPGHNTSTFQDVWTAYPLSITARQTNSYDCGLWVLATMAAIMKGYEVTGLKEPDMPAFHKLLLCLALCLPGSATAPT